MEQVDSKAFHVENMARSGVLIPAIEWVAEQIPGGFFIYRADEAMEMLYVNKACLNIFGCETVDEFKELTGYTFRGLVHPDDFQTIQDSIDEQIANPDNIEDHDYVEYRIIRKDGSIRWVDDYGHYADIPGLGEVYYVFIGDITEKHLAREYDHIHASVYKRAIEVLNEKAMGIRYDVIACIVGDRYGIVAKSDKEGACGICPETEEGAYSDYIDKCIAPALRGGASAADFSVSAVAEKLKDSESSSLDAEFEIEGETGRKRFTWYPAEREKDFYILTISHI